MCGIAGLIDLAADRPPPDLLRKMAGALRHRGPDGEGFLERPGLGLAARRLSIVDLAGGRQPMANEDQTVWVVFNGELFDHRELARDLTGCGHRLLTRCDTELLPHLWEEHGLEMFAHVRGQFAFTLWDERRRRLVLARDRFGICPLYWPWQGDWLLFASEIKALLASGWVPARPDLCGIDQLFTFVAVPGPATCFEGIQALQPGHYLSVQPAGPGMAAHVEDHTYWQIDFPDDGAAPSEKGLARLTDQFESVLYRAVERRLRADVPVVSYLSGGLDSSLIVAMASKALGTPVRTYTVGVTDPALDETAFAGWAARHAGSRSVLIPYDAAQMHSGYPRLVWAAETPVVDTSAAASLLLAERVHADGYKVALSGEGADEWLGGYPWLGGALLLHRLGSLPERWTDLAIAGHLRWLGAPPGTDMLIRRADQTLGGRNPWLVWTSLMGTARLRFYSRQMWQRLGAYDPFADLQLPAERLRRWHPLHRGLCVGARTLLAGMLLSAKGDRAAMHSSVETRYPFLDEDVFISSEYNKGVMATLTPWRPGHEADNSPPARRDGLFLHPLLPSRSGEGGLGAPPAQGHR
jgi:asparagine synthase (glutamine-hydrolysing)